MLSWKSQELLSTGIVQHVCTEDCLKEGCHRWSRWSLDSEDEIPTVCQLFRYSWCQWYWSAQITQRTEGPCKQALPAIDSPDWWMSILLQKRTESSWWLQLDERFVESACKSCSYNLLLRFSPRHISCQSIGQTMLWHSLSSYMQYGRRVAV